LAAGEEECEGEEEEAGGGSHSALVLSGIPAFLFERF
jgi:hypothetical protein